MKERVGRVGKVKEMSDLRNPYPGGRQMKSYLSQTWLEEKDMGSSNHPVQVPGDPLANSKTGLKSSTLLGSMLLRMIVSRGDEEHSSSA
jgi:hypothetical protein